MDIVERLQKIAIGGATGEAAAEITRLRTLLAERDHEIERLKLTPMSVIAPVSPKNVPETPPLPRVMLGTPVWIKDYDQLGPAPGFPVGFTCRDCGKRVKGVRHVDPRLLCFDCMPVANLNQGGQA